MYRKLGFVTSCDGGRRLSRRGRKTAARDGVVSKDGDADSARRGERIACMQLGIVNSGGDGGMEELEQHQGLSRDVRRYFGQLVG